MTLPGPLNSSHVSGCTVLKIRSLVACDVLEPNGGGPAAGPTGSANAGTPRAASSFGRLSCRFAGGPSGRESFSGAAVASPESADCEIAVAGDGSAGAPPNPPA